MKIPAPGRHAPTMVQIATYQSHGFNVIHQHTVDINPMGPPVEVDFSATDPDFIVRVAIKKAYEAGKSAGEAQMQQKVRDLLGLEPVSSDEN